MNDCDHFHRIFKGTGCLHGVCKLATCCHLWNTVPLVCSILFGHHERFQAVVHEAPCLKKKKKKKPVCLMDSGKDVEVNIHVFQAIQIHSIGLVRSHTFDNCE